MAAIVPCRCRSVVVVVALLALSATSSRHRTEYMVTDCAQKRVLQKTLMKLSTSGYDDDDASQNRVFWGR